MSNENQEELLKADTEKAQSLSILNLECIGEVSNEAGSSFAVGNQSAYQNHLVN